MKKVCDFIMRFLRFATFFGGFICTFEMARMYLPDMIKKITSKDEEEEL